MAENCLRTGTTYLSCSCPSKQRKFFCVTGSRGNSEIDLRFDSDPYSSSKVIHQRRSTPLKLSAQAMVNNFAPRGFWPVLKLVFGTTGSTVTPSGDDEYSDTKSPAAASFYRASDP